jgi:hypothetical protein
MPDPIGQLPASTALAEATPDSLAEAISRYDAAVASGQHGAANARQALEAIIRGMRDQRARWEAAEALQPIRAPRGAGKAPLSTKISASLDDLGI